MGKILKLRRRAGVVPEFEAVLARLSEELVLTESFTDLMIREGNPATAAVAIDEQRERLRDAEAVMLSAFRRPRRRLQTAVAGVAAIMMLGTGAIAAMRALAPATAPAKAAIERLEQGLEQAEAASSAAQASRIADTALKEAFENLGADVANPEIGGKLLELLDAQIARLEESGALPRSVTERLRRERRRVREALKVQPPPPPPSPSQQPPPAEPSPEPPPAPSPVSS